MHKVAIYFLLPLLLFGCGTRKTSSEDRKQGSVSTHALRDIGWVDSVDVENNDIARWREYGNSYAVTLGSLTKFRIYPATKVLTGRETLKYCKGGWAGVMNEQLGRVGIRVERIILSVPGYLMVFRSFEPIERTRIVDCLIHPNSFRAFEDKRYGGGVSYSSPDIYTTENMAVRELYEFPEERRILIVDHLRDRNETGDLCIAYILQDIGHLKGKARKKASNCNLGDHLDLKDIFMHKSRTYQYIERRLSPITVSLLPSCQFKEFVPRSKKELIPKNFLSYDEWKQQQRADSLFNR